MSIRARKIKGIKYTKDISFNLNHDKELADFLDIHGFYDNLNEGVGISEISIELLNKALYTIEKLDSETKKMLKKDIRWAEKRGDDYIQYYCF